MSTEVAAMHARISAQLGDAIAALRAVKGEFDATTEAAKKTDAATNDNSKSAGIFAKALENPQQALFYLTQNLRTLKDVGIQVFGELKQGAVGLELSDAFRTQVEQTGQSFERFRAKLREASGGTVSDFDLMQSASQSMSLRVTSDADQMAELLEIARFKARKFGIDTSQAFSDIVRGIGRTSPLILDNLGIVINADEAYASYAASIGTTAGALTDYQKKQAILNSVLQEGGQELAAAGGLTDSQADKFRQLEVAIENAKNKWLGFFANIFADISQEGNPIEGIFNPDAAADAANQLYTIIKGNAAVLGTLYDDPVARANETLSRLGEGDFSVLAENMAYTETSIRASTLLMTGDVEGFLAALEKTGNVDAINAYREAITGAATDTGYLTDATIDSNYGLGEQSRALEVNNDKANQARTGLSDLEIMTRAAADAMHAGAAGTNTFINALGGLASVIPGVASLLGMLGDARRAAEAGDAVAEMRAGRDSGYNLQYRMDKLREAQDAYNNAEGIGNQAEAYRDLVAAQYDVVDAQERISDEAETVRRANETAANAAAAANRRAANEAESAAKKAAREAERAAEQVQRAWEKAVDEVRSAVSSAIDLDINVGANDEILRAMGLQSEAVNENGRRLQDVINRGLESPWVNAFAELRGKTDQEVRATAAYIQDQINKFLRPDLLNREAILQGARDNIIGKRNRDALVEEITAQLVAEGYAVVEAQGAIADQFGADAIAKASTGGSDMVNAVMASTQASINQKQDLLKQLGKQTANPFIQGIIEEVEGFDLVEIVAQRVFQYQIAAAGG